MPKKSHRHMSNELNNLVTEQFHVVDKIFENYTSTSNDLSTIYNIILITSVVLLLSIFRFKVKPNN
jgi:hypothetical protein